MICNAYDSIVRMTFSFSLELFLMVYLSDFHVTSNEKVEIWLFILL